MFALNQPNGKHRNYLCTFACMMKIRKKKLKLLKSFLEENPCLDKNMNHGFYPEKYRTVKANHGFC